MKNTHLHHIIPKHMGGTDDPSNLIELTVEEHAEAHRKLYKEHGSIYDLVAWKALSGQITTDEARRLAVIATWTGREHTEEAKEKIREARLDQIPPNLGRKFSKEHRKKISERQKNIPKSYESNQKRSKTMSGIAKPKVKCPHCGKEGGAPQMKQWHFDNCKRKAF